MIRLRNAVLAVSIVLFAVGCSPDDRNATGHGHGGAGSASDRTVLPTTESPPLPPPPPPPPPASGAGGERAGPIPVPETASKQPASPPVPRPQPASAPATVLQAPGPTTPARSARVGRQPSSIRLSGGVALAQTLPTGTAMGFSVDYQFAQGGPNSSSRYLWVVEPSKGPPAKMDVRLQERGTLQTFVLQLRPEHGPFKSHIEDGNGSRLSRSIPLR